MINKPTKIYYCKGCNGLTIWHYFARQTYPNKETELYNCESCGTTIHENVLIERTNRIIKDGLSKVVEE